MDNRDVNLEKIASAIQAMATRTTAKAAASQMSPYCHRWNITGVPTS